MTIDDLREQWKTGADLEELSRFLFRNWEEVAQKRAEFDLEIVRQPQRRQGFLAKKIRKGASKGDVGDYDLVHFSPAEQIEQSYDLAMMALADYLTHELDTSGTVEDQPHRPR